MDNKEKKKLMIIIIVLTVALLGTTTYIVYDKIIRKEEIKEIKPKEEKKPKEEQTLKRALTQEEQNQMLNQIKDYTEVLGNKYLTDENMALNNQQALNFALVQIGTLKDSIMESEIEKVLDTYFGVNHPYRHEDIDCFAEDGILYEYNRAKREYIFKNSHGHGGQGSFSAEIFYIDGQVENTTYTIKVHMIYGDYCGGLCGPSLSYYQTAEDSMNGKNPILGPYEEKHQVTGEEYESIKSSLPVVTFTFENDQKGNYGLKNVKI